MERKFASPDDERVDAAGWSNAKSEPAEAHLKPAPGQSRPPAQEPADHPTDLHKSGGRTSWDKRWPPELGEEDDDDADVADDSPEDDRIVARPRWRTPLSIVGLLVMAVVIVIALEGKLPSLPEIGRAIATAQWWWVFVAAIAMVISITAFAEQQRVLLHTFGARMTRLRMTAVTYGGTALTNSLPAGAAVAAGFSFKQYRLIGANRSTAATVMVLSGLLSAGSLALLYFLVIGIATATPFVTMLTNHPTIAGVVGLLALAVVGLLIWRSVKAGPRQLSDKPTPRLDRLEARSHRLAVFARDGLETLRQARLVRVRYLTLAIGWTVLKWAAEAICLLASCWAFDLRISLLPLAVIYLSVQLVRQIPFTPGGIGLVEASLLAGLVSAGAAHGSAGAAVVIYRLLSAWIMIPVGFALLGEMKRRDARRAALGSGPR